MKQKLIDAEKKANFLFKEIENKGLIIEGKTEKQLNTEVLNLAFELFQIRKYFY